MLVLSQQNLFKFSWLVEWQGKRDREIFRVLVHSPYSCTGQSQEPKASSRFPIQVTGVQVLGLSSAAFPGWINNDMDQKWNSQTLNQQSNTDYQNWPAAPQFQSFKKLFLKLGKNEQMIYKIINLNNQYTEEKTRNVISDQEVQNNYTHTHNQTLHIAHNGTEELLATWNETQFIYLSIICHIFRWSKNRTATWEKMTILTETDFKPTPKWYIFWYVPKDTQKCSKWHYSLQSKAGNSSNLFRQ